MLLSQWVAECGGRREVASLLDVTEQALHYWLAGKATPELKTVFKIIELSKGRVSVKEIFDETKIRERCAARRRAPLASRAVTS